MRVQSLSRAHPITDAWAFLAHIIRDEHVVEAAVRGRDVLIAKVDSSPTAQSRSFVAHLQKAGQDGGQTSDVRADLCVEEG